MSKCNLLFILLLTISSGFSFAQRDFNNFENLKAKGDIPADFIDKGFEKIAADIDLHTTELKKGQERVFLEGVYYAIDDLLHSGVVVYGDEVSTYVTKIANKLLEKDAELKDKLRFYTIKSNETNAFSTYQGIIFVTTGLISQLTNEAQLAYVLSHEIAHYTEKHVVQTFDYNAKNRKSSDRIQSLSTFSKENEFEADKIGIKMYNDAGYSKDELISTFDVLLYSHLPFDDQEISLDYFKSDLIHIPDGYYSKTKYPIKASEDQDDSKSSHPNIKKRKEAVKKELENYKNWKEDKYQFGEKEFLEIRTICRFESIRSDIIDAEFDDALYSIYILEKNYPNSIYLQRMKAKAWLGCAQYRSVGGLGKMLPSEKKLEAEIGNLQYFLNNLSKNQLVTIGMRTIEDLRKINPEDQVINGVWEKMVKTMAISTKMDLSLFSKTKFEEIKSAKDTLVKVDEEKLTKYEKIKLKNDVGNLAADTVNFYLFALTDILKSGKFTETFQAFIDEKDEKEKEENEFAKMTSRERKRYLEKSLKDKEKYNSLICLEPMVQSYTKRGLNRVKSEKMQIVYTNAIEEVSKDFGFNTTILGSENLLNNGTDAFNQRAVLFSYFSEISDNDRIEVFPTDFNQLLEIKEKTGTNMVMLSILEHEKSNKVKPAGVLACLIIYPILFYYVPNNILKSNQIFYTTLFLNLDSGKIEKKYNFKNYDSLDTYTMKARLYNMFKEIN